jgi:hypothetical protein
MATRSPRAAPASLRAFLTRATILGPGSVRSQNFHFGHDPAEALRQLFGAAMVVRSGTSLRFALGRLFDKLRYYGAAGDREVGLVCENNRPRRRKMTNHFSAEAPATKDYATVHVAWELSKGSWKLGILVPGAERMSCFTVKGGDLAAVGNRCRRHLSPPSQSQEFVNGSPSKKSSQ